MSIGFNRPFAIRDWPRSLYWAASGLTSGPSVGKKAAQIHILDSAGHAKHKMVFLKLRVFFENKINICYLRTHARKTCNAYTDNEDGQPVTCCTGPMGMDFIS